MGTSQSISQKKYSSLIEHYATFSELLIYGYIRGHLSNPYFTLLENYFFHEISYDHCYECPIPMITITALQSIISFYGEGDEFNNFKYDFLECRYNKSCKDIIYKHGDNFPEKEYIALSLELIKINKRNKEQQRIMVITNKGVYHFSSKNGKPRNRKYKKILRRISIEKIIAITSSDSNSNEFAFHIPSEYDTRYRSKYKNVIINALCSVYTKIEGRKLMIINTPSNTLSSMVITKDIAKKQTENDKLKRVRSYVESCVENQRAEQQREESLSLSLSLYIE